MTLDHEIEIAAPVQRVWELTLDIERWPDITPTMTTVERLDPGPLAVGSRARIDQPRQRPRIWTVSRLDAPNRFEWDARLGPMTMRGIHHIDASDAGSRNRVGLEITGRGSRLFGLLAGPMLRRALATENKGFKRAAESTSG